jgi:hypothetical protein
MLNMVPANAPADSITDEFSRGWTGTAKYIVFIVDYPLVDDNFVCKGLLSAIR